MLLSAWISACIPALLAVSCELELARTPTSLLKSRFLFTGNYHSSAANAAFLRNRQASSSGSLATSDPTETVGDGSSNDAPGQASSSNSKTSSTSFKSSSMPSAESTSVPKCLRDNPPPRRALSNCCQRPYRLPSTARSSDR